MVLGEHLARDCSYIRSESYWENSRQHPQQEDAIAAWELRHVVEELRVLLAAAPLALGGKHGSWNRDTSCRRRTTRKTTVPAGEAETMATICQHKDLKFA